MNPFLATDGYKTGHHKMYPKGTTLVYSNFTPRSNKYAPKGCDKVVSFGQQMVMQQIYDMFERDFFEKAKDAIVGEIEYEYGLYLNAPYDASHIADLHDLGYLPIHVKALAEGTTVPIGVPVLTIQNTVPEFFWLTNFLETLISNLLWKPMTSATIALQYRKNLTKWALKTDEENVAFVDFQGHDFSMRGMDSIDATIASGLGHATSFLGSDSLPVIHGARQYYHEFNGFVVGSVNATEHSVMCAGGDGVGEELNTFRYLMEQFPTGILSIVSDTWNLWDVLTKYLPVLKPEILERDGKIVIRPDSGNPVDIICGRDRESYSETRPIIVTSDEWDAVKNHTEQKGVIELLWETFGGTVNKQGYKVLDPHIGAIYGDSITVDRAEEICERLEAKGFASTNIVLGIGSFTYQFNTRDTFGFAMKATYVEIQRACNKEYGACYPNNCDGTCVTGREIYKDPITDDGTKKSAKGLLMVEEGGDKYILYDGVSKAEEATGFLQTIFLDGEAMNKTTLNEVRTKLKHFS
tara:strand:+ start:1313 stop:2881 length:1569 start_codon:yes stop_codon:yes gene_type:complete